MISASAIDSWLVRLSAGAQVFVPQRDDGGNVVLGPAGQRPRLADYRRLTESPKRILLPQVDELLEFHEGQARPLLDDARRILFGLRPCDAAAIEILDNFFGRKFADPNYQARRREMSLIVAACARSEDNCFCLSTQTGPSAESGFDVQLFDMGEEHLARAGTATGEQLIAAGGELFADAPADAENRLEEFLRDARASQRVRLDLGKAQAVVAAHAEPEDFWDKLADQCMICGGCTYNCPTCTCSNLSDRTDSADEGTRRRLWDSCILEGFTREASGHNPRRRQAARCAHRYLHKLGGSDLPGRRFRCVGCGRCVDVCISRLNFLRVVEDLMACDVPAATSGSTNVGSAPSSEQAALRAPG